MTEIRHSKAPLEPMAYVPGRTGSWNSSWRQIYDHFGQAILAYSHRRGLNDHSAEDVLQEVMMTLIRGQHGLESRYDPRAGSFQAWLWGVIRNRVRAVRRKDQKEEPLPPMAPVDDDAGPAAPRLPEVVQPAPDFAQTEEDEWQKSMLAGALLKVQARVAPKNFAIYTALLKNEALPQELAETYGMETNAIYRVKNRCHEMLLEEARALRDSWDSLRQQPNQ